jgi:hypothetical protein
MEKFIAKAHAAAIMELLMRGGRAKTEAARHTAHAVDHWPIFASINVTATTVVNWRDNVKAKLASEDRDKSFFDHLIESGLDLSEGPLEAAKMLIEEAIPYGPRQRKT